MLHPAKNWRLLNHFVNGRASDGFIGYVRMFGIIGILVLIIACINFVNLSTARAEKRAREVGVRKAIGSTRKHLIIQFLSESLLLTFFAFLLAIGLVQLVLPAFNNLAGIHIAIPWTSPVFWCLMFAYVAFTGILAGSRPAFYLSSFQPVKVLKGTIQAGKHAALPRKILLVVQFSCSVALITGTLVIYQQINYAKDRPRGYNGEGLVGINNSEDLDKNYPAFKNELLQTGQVASVTRSATGMVNFPASFRIIDWPGKQPGESIEINTTAVAETYFSTVGMAFVVGNDFTGNEGADTSTIVINEAAADKLRLQDPVNQLIRFDYSEKPMRITGVVKNAVIGSPFYAARPAIYVYNPGWTGAILFRLKQGTDTKKAMEKTATIFKKYNPSFTFDYSFADDLYNNTFRVEAFVGSLASIFAGLAIFISCLGLFGLAAYTAEQRKKEIGIRKVLGASVSQVWLLLSRDFLLLVLISCLIASPLSFYFLHSWLEKFDYRIAMGPGMFILSAAITVVITILTISYQSISSALSNPVNSLRNE